MALCKNGTNGEMVQIFFSVLTLTWQTTLTKIPSNTPFTHKYPCRPNLTKLWFWVLCSQSFVLVVSRRRSWSAGFKDNFFRCSERFVFNLEPWCHCDWGGILHFLELMASIELVWWNGCENVKSDSCHYAYFYWTGFAWNIAHCLVWGLKCFLFVIYPN
jgi:hypothetical protein